MDNIKIKGLKVYAYHGMLEKEKKEGQDFYIDASLKLDSLSAGQSDNISETVNYANVCDFIVNTTKNNNWNLIEAIGENLVVGILNQHKVLQSATITINKPNSPIDHELENISVSVKRQWNHCAVGFGSNIGDRQGYIDAAINTIKESDYFKDVKVSKIIESEPYGYTNQAQFLNGVFTCKTLYSPYELLKYLQKLELYAKRERVVHWGPRTLDLDILLYGNEIINDKKLTVPHYDMVNREFVLKSLSELIPNISHPVFGKTIKQLWTELKNND